MLFQLFSLSCGQSSLANVSLLITAHPHVIGHYDVCSRLLAACGR